MRRDGLTPEDVWAGIEAARRQQRLGAEKKDCLSGAIPPADKENRDGSQSPVSASSLCEGILPLVGALAAFLALLALLAI